MSPAPLCAWVCVCLRTYCIQGEGPAHWVISFIAIMLCQATLHTHKHSIGRINVRAHAARHYLCCISGLSAPKGSLISLFFFSFTSSTADARGVLLVPNNWGGAVIQISLAQLQPSNIVVLVFFNIFGVDFFDVMLRVIASRFKWHFAGLFLSRQHLNHFVQTNFSVRFESVRVIYNFCCFSLWKWHLNRFTKGFERI